MLAACGTLHRRPARDSTGPRASTGSSRLFIVAAGTYTLVDLAVFNLDRLQIFAIFGILVVRIFLRHPFMGPLVRFMEYFRVVLSRRT